MALAFDGHEIGISHFHSIWERLPVIPRAPRRSTLKNSGKFLYLTQWFLLCDSKCDNWKLDTSSPPKTISKLLKETHKSCKEIWFHFMTGSYKNQNKWPFDSRANALKVSLSQRYFSKLTLPRLMPLEFELFLFFPSGDAKGRWCWVRGDRGSRHFPSVANGMTARKGEKSKCACFGQKRTRQDSYCGFANESTFYFSNFNQKNHDYFNAWQRFWVTLLRQKWRTEYEGATITSGREWKRETQSCVSSSSRFDFFFFPGTKKQFSPLVATGVFSSTELIWATKAKSFAGVLPSCCCGEGWDISRVVVVTYLTSCGGGGWYTGGSKV